MVLIWLQFIICALLIVFCGSRLSQYGDVIAEKTKLGRTWIGVVLMATVTSLPELVTSISSAAVFHVPDISAGNVLGACMLNLFILAVLDAGQRKPPISSLAHQGQSLTAAFGILLLGVTGISILGGDTVPAAGWIGISSVVSLALYLVGMRLVFKYERRRASELLEAVAEEMRYEHLSKSDAYVRFGVSALIIAAAGTYLPHVADQIALMTGWGQTFVGTIFVALVTTLPEMVVSYAALRMDAVDLAVGNVLGSNLFNVAILAIADIAYVRGPILREVAASHAITAVAAMTMTSVVMVALVFRTQKKVLSFSWDSLGIILTYAATSLLLFLKR
jgi:cation:H+ antiporter